MPASRTREESEKRAGDAHVSSQRNGRARDVLVAEDEGPQRSRIRFDCRIGRAEAPANDCDRLIVDGVTGGARGHQERLGIGPNEVMTQACELFTECPSGTMPQAKRTVTARFRSLDVGESHA